MSTLHQTNRPHETFAGYSELEVMCCPNCGVLYALPQRLLETARKDPDRWWWCPNGHNLHFPGKTEADRLRDELNWTRQQRDTARAQREHAENQARAEKAAKTRIRNDRNRIRDRVGAGVCPCCNRTFQQLGRHMKTKHPDYREPGDG
jgi:hypothetical protein